MSGQTALGTFEVSGSVADAEAFRAATGLTTGATALPLTFPMRWLAEPTIRAAMIGLVPESDIVLVHESQSFDYVTPLLPGTPYAMTLTGHRRANPDQLVVAGTIADADGATVATLEMILRLFSGSAVDA